MILDLVCRDFYRNHSDFWTDKACDTDLLVSDGGGWDTMRLIDVDAQNPPPASTVALLRFQNKDGDWRQAGLPASLVTLMAKEEDDSSALWALSRDRHGPDGTPMMERRTQGPAGAVDSGASGGKTLPAPPPQMDYWALKSVEFSAAMASFPPSGTAGLGIAWQRLPSPAPPLAAINTGTILA